MPRPLGSTKTPTYRRHKASGQAIVTIDGTDIYLGPHGTQASKREYDRVISEWLAGGRKLTVQADVLTLVELINMYRKYAESYYGDAGEYASIVLAIRQLNRLYGHTRVSDFGPLALKAVRDVMVGVGWSRKYINVQIGRIIRMFRWGVENEKVRVEVLQALRSVQGLRRGKTTAKEMPPVRPVSDELVAATLPHVAPQVKAMIELQQITGARPGEITIMRGCDIDTSGQVWQYRPESHKTQYRGHERIIYLGPRAQDVVKPFLRLNPLEYLFRADEGGATRRAKRTEARTTPDSCGNRPGTNRVKKPKRAPGDRYDVAAYRRAIERGCDLAYPPPGDLARLRVQGRKKDGTRLETVAEWKARLGKRWAELEAWRDSHRWHPHQLRHSAATRLRRQYGLEAAQILLGHQNSTVTERYAEPDHEAATKVMAEVG